MMNICIHARNKVAKSIINDSCYHLLLTQKSYVNTNLFVSCLKDYKLVGAKLCHVI